VQHKHATKMISLHVQFSLLGALEGNSANSYFMGKKQGAMEVARALLRTLM